VVLEFIFPSVSIAFVVEQRNIYLGMSSFTKLSRAMTFDDRKVGRHASDGHTFTKLTKRSMTFAEKIHMADKAKDEPSNLSIPDVLFRRHFGQSDKEPKPFSVLMKAKSFVEPVRRPAVQEDNSGKAVVVTDTFSTGAQLANTLFKMGYKVICVLSADLKDLLKMVPEGLEVTFAATITLDTAAEYTAALQSVIDQISAVGLPVVGVFPGAETGVELADALSEAMGLLTNGTAQSEARRNKYVMGETIRAAGLRAVKQLRASVWGEIAVWLEEWNPDPFKVIVKPVDSAGSDDVTLCHSFEQVQAAFGNIVGKVNGLGIVNRAVLVQEYLEGQEYILDLVSRDGEHKVAAVWAYDRRAVNGAGFVCFGQRLLMADEPHVRELIAYQKKVITALGIKHGPTHGEVKWFKGEPVLVEVGARCQGADGLWVKIVNEALGYDQVQCTIDSILYPDRFAALPEEVCLYLPAAYLVSLIG
jgi:biotin carboxylase